MKSPSARPERGVRVVVVDDHAVVRRGLVDLINDEPGLAACGQAATVAEALAVVETLKADLVIVDITLGTENGLDLVATLRKSYPAVRILVLSAHDELLFAERALKAGAHGYIMKAESSEALLAALRRVASGKRYVSEAVSERLLAAVSGQAGEVDVSPLDRLSDRERHVLRLVGQGLTTRGIAEELSVSVKTIESHQAHIKEKLGLRTGRELVRLAVSWTNGSVG